MIVEKRYGAVYTPDSIVSLILEETNLFNREVFENARVCDPSCGDGAFLVGLVRHIASFGLPRKTVKKVFEQMAGFDVDDAALAKCRRRLDGIVYAAYPSLDIRWRLENRDALNRDAFEDVREQFTHVVGNPPYVRVQNLERAGREKANSWALAKGATDLYVVFFELGFELLRTGGVLGYITPSSWLRSQAGRALRRHLATKHAVKKIIDFGSKQMFPKVSTYTAVSVVEKGREQGEIPVYVYKAGSLIGGERTIQIDRKKTTAPWIAATEENRKLLVRLSKRGPKLGEIADIHVGLQTLADKVFILNMDPDVTGIPVGHTLCLADGISTPLEDWLLKPIVKASKVRHNDEPSYKRVIFPYDAEGNLLPEEDIRQKAPRAYAWLRHNRDRLLARDKGRFDPRRWYGFGRQVSIVSGFGDKLLTSGMNYRPSFLRFTNPGTTFYSGYCVKPRIPVDMNLLQAALNSKEMGVFIRMVGQPYRYGYFSYAKSYIQHFPIPREVLLTP